MTESRHGFLHYLMVFNKPWFEAQSQANQAILVQAMQEAGRWQRTAMMDRDADATQRIKAAGVQVNELSAQAREQLRQLALKVHERFADRVGKDYLQRVYAESRRPPGRSWPASAAEVRHGGIRVGTISAGLWSGQGPHMVPFG